MRRAYHAPVAQPSLGATAPPENAPPRRIGAQPVVAFLAPAGLVAYLALDGAGFDLVVRQRVALAVCGLVAFGFAFGVLPRGRPDRLALIPALALGALVAWTAASLAWTASAERTVAEIARLCGYGGLVALAFTALDRETFRVAAAGLSVAALGIAAVAVASRLAPAAFPGAEQVSAAFPNDRLSYPLDYWNAIGAWGAMACAIGLAWSAHAQLASIRVIGLAAVPVAGLAVYLSYSRGGTLAVVIAVAAVLALSSHRWTALWHALAAGAATGLVILVVRQHDQIADGTGAAGGAAVALALLGAAVLCAGAVLVTRRLHSDRFRLAPRTARQALAACVAAVLATGVVVTTSGVASEAWDGFNEDDTPVTVGDPAGRLASAGGKRDELWESALDALAAHPVRGVGPGTYEFWWQRESAGTENVEDAHSLPLEFAAELGLPGLALLLAFLGGALALALRARRSLSGPDDRAASIAMTAAFIVFLFSSSVDWMWEETAVGALALAAIAVAGAAGSAPRRADARIGAAWARPAIVAAAVAAAAVQVPGIVSTQDLRHSREALSEGDIERARELAESAIDWQPWAATPHAQLALVHRRAGDLADAAAEFETAIEKEPTNQGWQAALRFLEREREAGSTPSASSDER
jgi:hypothetical protein